MEAPEVKAFDAQTVISMEHTGSYDEIGQVYHRLYDWARSNHVTVKGPGMTTFLVPPNEFDAGTAVYDVCLPVAGEPTGDSEVTVKEIPACTAACVTVKGPYSEIPGHYTELLAWLSVEGLTVAGHPREVYVKRPAKAGEGGPDDFVTEIQFPIEP